MLDQQIKNELQTALDFAIKKTRDNLSAFTCKFPSANSVNLVYQPVDNASMEYCSDWTSSFWTGMIWLAYEMDGGEDFLKVGKGHIQSFEKRLKERDILDHHDIGFLYSLSCVAGYRAAGIEEGRKIAIDAAYLLTERYHEKAMILQQNGSMTKKSPSLGRFIIDSILNLPLLYWASDVTGDRTLYEKAYNHLKQVMKYICRPDGSTYQVCILDVDTAEVVFQGTEQGASAEACWSRGQAWAIYGMVLSYIYTGNIKCIKRSKMSADYFLNNLPKDGICAWDLAFKDNEVQKDSSAAAIAVCGLLELARQLPPADPDRERYEKAAVDMLLILARDYTTKDLQQSNGLLLHGVYSLPGGHGIDECCIWGDYFYMEALVRLLYPWRMYW